MKFLFLIFISALFWISCEKNNSPENEAMEPPDNEGEISTFAGIFIGTTHYIIDAAYYNWFVDTLYMDTIFIEELNDSLLSILWNGDTVSVDSFNDYEFYFYEELSGGATKFTLSGALLADSTLTVQSNTIEFVHGSSFEYEFLGVKSQ